MKLRVWVLSFGFWGFGVLGFCVLGSEFWVFGLWVCVLGFRFWGKGLGIFGFWVMYGL